MLRAAKSHFLGSLACFPFALAMPGPPSAFQMFSSMPGCCRYAAKDRSDGGEPVSVDWASTPVDAKKNGKQTHPYLLFFMLSPGRYVDGHGSILSTSVATRTREKNHDWVPSGTNFPCARSEGVGYFDDVHCRSFVDGVRNAEAHLTRYFVLGAKTRQGRDRGCGGTGAFGGNREQGKGSGCGNFARSFRQCHEAAGERGLLAHL